MLLDMDFNSSDIHTLKLISYPNKRKYTLGLLHFNSSWPSDAIWRQEIWVNIGSGNGLLPDGTKPLPEPMLSYHQ